MDRIEFTEERKVAEVQGDVRQERGINWAVISFVLIIVVMIIAGILFTMLPSGGGSRNNQNTTSGAPIDGR